MGLVDVFGCAHFDHAHSCETLALLILGGSGRVVFKVGELLVVMAEIVVFYQLEVLLLETLWPSLASLALRPLGALAVFLIILKSKNLRLLLIHDGVRGREHIYVTGLARDPLFILRQAIGSKACCNPLLIKFSPECLSAASLPKPRASML